MKKVFALILALIMCMTFICGCDSDSQKDDSWKSKTWDQMDDNEKGKTYNYIKDKVEKSWY